jgi:hypothetical protein
VIVDDLSNQFVTNDVDAVNLQESYGMNSTALTFAGVLIEAAILTDSDEGQQEIQILGD